ncbi:MAG: ABC transporter ATP-binding protein [Candidatus Geothermarchaeales archaeon]
MSAEVLATRGLWKTYDPGEPFEVEVLTDVNLSVKRGEFVLLSGPSGCGKTTLLNLLGGLDEPTRGEVLLEGVRISGLSQGRLSRVRSRSIGFIFQHFNLLPSLTVRENVELPMVYAGVPRGDRGRRVGDLLERFDLSGLGDRLPSRLSGGQMQRVAAVRALANDPLVVLADEPTSNLDEESSEMLLGMLSEMNREDGKTVVLASNYPEPAGRYAGRHLVFRLGGLEELGEESAPSEEE